MRIIFIISLILLSALSYAYASETVIIDSSTAVTDSTVQSTQATTPTQIMTETQSFERGRIDGKAFTLPNKWFYLGVLHGSTLFIPGIAIASFCATGKEAPSIPSNVDMRSYRLGYLKQSRYNSRNSALIGGCIGAIILYTAISIADH